MAREFFRAEHGRDPVDARELAGQIAKDSRPKSTTVAGFDLTFSPVKSVSTLWAVADRRTSAAIERAHQAAVRDALRFIEQHALFTRTGAQGIRQVNVRGLVATAFTHRDSRAGDPDLHTHVAVANKVQTLDGRWLAIDGRVLYNANVAASETYNTALEHHLRDTLGVRFAERAGTDPTKRPIREIVGVDPRLNERWSSRRAAIKVRTRCSWPSKFQDDHGRPPTPVEMLHLAQQATLETRDAKHEPRSLAEQRTTWMSRSSRGPRQPATPSTRWSSTLCNPNAMKPTSVDSDWVSSTADRILTVVEEHRATWQIWHVRAEAQRQVRAADIPTEQVDALVDLLIAEVLDHRCVALVAPADGIEEPETLRRTDGSSVYTVAGTTRYTSQRILDAEQRLIAAAGRPRRDRRRPVGGRPGAARTRRERHRPRRRSGRPGPGDVHLRCPAAVGDRPGRRREDHRHARPHPGLDPRRRPGHRPRPVRRRSRRPRRADRHPHRHPRQTHLVHQPQPAPRLGRRHRTVNVGDHRRSRDGRHPVPRHEPSSSPSTAAPASG